MSAINVFTYSDGAVIWTDAASYLADGTLAAISSKVHPLPHLNAVIAARAPSLFLPLIGLRLGQSFDSFDAMISGLAQETRIFFGLHSQIFSMCDLGPDFDLVVCGWSENRGACETWIMCSQARGELAAWTPHQMGPVALMPYDDALGAVLTLSEAQLGGALHPVEDGLRIIEAQRNVKVCQGKESVPSHGVGGFAQMTLLGREQIETRVMRRWPDKLGIKLGA
jgi:hypothetical protein